jgi:membrane protease YdiL (CAAX protease family)
VTGKRLSTVTSRRQARVVAAFGVGGAGLLGCSLSRRPGSKEFYALTVGVAGAWTAAAVFAGIGPPVWGYTQKGARIGAVKRAALLGIGAFGMFYGLAHVARRTPVLKRAISRALVYEERGSTPLVLLVAAVNAGAEEVFFRGALWSVVQDRKPILTTTLAYMAVTAATGNLALVIAGGATGLLFGYQRRATGGIAAPTVSHLIWSILMLRYLPSLFRLSAE